ncbi:MAG: sulfite exporter TauE/SafE family protein [Stagnimonas sp.]|nr:sulfite exporter TauE/SafE family protein [Stagnimonas sp.]
MSLTPTLIAALTFCGFGTAFLSGVAGLGGGTILIGVLYAAGMAPAEAVPLFAAVQLVSNSSRTVAYLKHVEWRAAGWFSLAAVPATFLVAPFAAAVNPDLVCLILAALILVSLAPGKADKAPLPARSAYLSAGLLNGSLGMFVGATGLFVGRLFFRPEWSKETTIGTLALTQVIGHGLRVLAYGLVGFSVFAQPRLLLPLALAVIAGTWAGKRANARISRAHFDRLFKAILLLLSTKLLYDGITGLLGRVHN